MVLALVDASIWVAIAQIPMRPTPANAGQPLSRQRGAGVVGTRARVGVLAAESLLYDALLVAMVAAALLVSR